MVPVLNLWESVNIIGNVLTHYLRELGGPCVKPMGISEWVTVYAIFFAYIIFHELPLSHIFASC